MKKVHEVCKSIGVSKRTLQYYDEIELLSPSERTEAGYRLYDDVAVEKLWKILLLRELGYPLKDIKRIMDDPDFDLRYSIEKHIEVLIKEKQRLENLIGYASTIKMTGIIPFHKEYEDTTFAEFIEDSKKTWNMNLFAENTDGDNNLFDYELMKKFQHLAEEYIKQSEKGLNDDEINNIAERLLDVFDLDILLELNEYIDEFKNLIGQDVNSREVQKHVGELYDHINHLTDRSLSLNGFSLYGQMFTSGGDLGLVNTKRLGCETTDFITKAIQAFCDNRLAGQK